VVHKRGGGVSEVVVGVTVMVVIVVVVVVPVVAVAVIVAVVAVTVVVVAVNVVVGAVTVRGEERREREVDRERQGREGAHTIEKGHNRLNSAAYTVHTVSAHVVDASFASRAEITIGSSPPLL
jgi:hypothetical protein